MIVSSEHCGEDEMILHIEQCCLIPRVFGECWVGWVTEIAAGSLGTFQGHLLRCVEVWRCVEVITQGPG